MDMFRKMKAKLKDNKGFSLIELIIVVLMIGILSTIVVNQFSGSVTNAAKARGIESCANKMQIAWSAITANQGAPTNAIAVTGGTVQVDSDLVALTALVTGSDAAIAADYKDEFKYASLRPLDNIIGGNAVDGYTYEGYVMTINTSATNGKISITFANVPAGIIEMVAGTDYSVTGPVSGKLTYDLSAADAAASDLTFTLTL